MRPIAILIMLLIPALAAASPIGKGGTTATCIDWDNDGYGVGPGCTGPDADDNDATVTTAAHGIAKYGSLPAFLSHLGYSPTTYWYVDATAGNDSTCVANDATKPCRTYGHIHSTIGADRSGVIVLFRAGTHNSDDLVGAYPTPHGAAGNPFVLMAYPGEQAVIDRPGQGIAACLDDDTPYSYITVDGFKIINSTNPGLGQVLNGCALQHFTVRNVEGLGGNSSGFGRGIFAMQNMTDLLLERNVIHGDGTMSSHTIYLGSRDKPNSNLTVRNNILYNPGITCLQHNGQITSGLVFDGNICYGTVQGAGGLSIEMGGNNATVVNNVVFDTNGPSLTMADYPTPDQGLYPGLQPRPMTGNVIANNTFVMGSLNWKTGGALLLGPQPNISIARNDDVQTADIWSNTIRNNVLVNTSGAAPLMVRTGWGTYACYSMGTCDGSGAKFTANGLDPTDYAKLLIIDHNLFYASSSSILQVANNLNGNGSGTPPTAAPATVNYGLNWSQFTAFSGTYTGNLSGNPLLVRNNDADAQTPSLYDFHLSTGSPAINAGSTTAPATDITGATRTAPDIGAYEYLGALPSSTPSLSGTICGSIH